MNKSGGGTGSVFLVKGSDVFHFKFYKDGECYRGSTGKRTENEARKVLAEKLFDAGAGKIETAASRRITLADLSKLVFDYYRNNRFDTPKRQRQAFDWLEKFFGARCPVSRITTTRIEEYIQWRPQQPDDRSSKRKFKPERYKNPDGTLRPPRIGCDNATINRELTALKLAFKLAKQQGKLTTSPYFTQLKENGPRSGIFKTYGDFAAVRAQLPEYLKIPATVGYYTGWRLPSDILTRKKHHLSGDGKWLSLDVGEAKNEKPKKFPLHIIPELFEVVQAQVEANRKFEIETGRAIDLLFHRDGKPIKYFYDQWHHACARAGFAGRIPHDFRRTAASNLIAAGVDPYTVAELVGWKGIAMLLRYNIVDERSLERGVEKLAAHLEAQKNISSNVRALRS